jgi:diaminopimelate decarboxylase
MNDLIRPALYSGWHQVLPVQANENEPTEQWDLVGPVCETGDFLAKDRALALEAGDVLAVMSAGAYGFVMASNYNSRPRPVELLVEGDSVRVVRERESIESLWAGEQV